MRLQYKSGETSIKMQGLTPAVHEAHILLALRQSNVALPKNVVVMRKEDASQLNANSEFGQAEAIAMLYSLFTPYNAVSVDVLTGVKKDKVKLGPQESRGKKTSARAIVTFPDAASAQRAKEAYHMKEVRSSSAHLLLLLTSSPFLLNNFTQGIFGTQIVELQSDVASQVWINNSFEKKLAKAIETVIKAKPPNCVLVKKPKQNTAVVYKLRYPTSFYPRPY